MQSVKSIYAILADHFKLTLEQIGNLTDRQINEIYFAERDEKTGAIISKESKLKPYQRPDTYAQDLQDLFRLNGIISKENFDECLDKIRKKWGK